MISNLNEIKNNYEKKNLKIKGKTEKKNADVSDGMLNIKKKKVNKVVEFLEKKTHSTMSDFSLIDNLRDLTNLLSDRNSGNIMLGYPLRYEENPIRKESLESLMEEIVDSNDI